eukprot:TRINITY_DN4918_c0_g2_i3.p1 TRINITY_DN4918_c0_g2~~TRINITY_DN4918_c0_g2_i3.p1  ORF type:complete len:125 (-),score=18.67 TRINITY_DN4918_c0_g2_i3:142-516(-)
MERYDKLKLLNQGAMGKVWLGKNIESSENVAIKIIDLESTDGDLSTVEAEVHTLSQLFCPNICKYITSFVKGSELWIVMEYLAGGSLADIIHALGSVDEDFIRAIIKQILVALDYLHSQKFVIL